MLNIDETLPKLIKSVSEIHPDLPIVKSKNKEGLFQDISYKDFFDLVRVLGSGLLKLGVTRGSHIGIISDNRKEWLMCDVAILGLGAIDVPRGCDSTEDEIAFILKHADCKITILENDKQLEKIISKKDDLANIEKIIMIESSSAKLREKSGKEVILLDEVFKLGEKTINKEPSLFDEELLKGNSNDTATVIYTSGTTGEPKGVMLQHKSFLFQIERANEHLNTEAGDVLLSVLPIWHSFERAVEYVIISIAGSIAYSKPIGKILLNDIKQVQPQWFSSVPRIWEGVRNSIYKKINKEGGAKKALFYAFVAICQNHSSFAAMLKGLTPEFEKRYRYLDIIVSIIPFILLSPLKILGDLLIFNKIRGILGNRFKAGISGGGALPKAVDNFFQAAGILLLEGYGLTEAGPVLAVRVHNKPVHSTVGPIFKYVEHKVLDPEGNEMPPGKKGVLHVKSPQIMQGYYKRPEETEKVLRDGWLNTGDIAVFTLNNEFKILGREKDTIVLLGGENIEPVPIEDKLLTSEYIDQVMVLGQDQKFLAALIVPNMEKLEEIAAEKRISYIEPEELINNPSIQEVVHDEIQALVNTKNGFKVFERIFRFKLLPKAFEEGRELTHTLKIRRNVVNELYRKEIKGLFK